MPYVTSNDVRIYYETTGVGAPIIFCHEFAGGYESWEPQVEYFSSRYQVVTWNVRGYPPSDVPESVDSYSQDASIEDLVRLIEAAKKGCFIDQTMAVANNVGHRLKVGNDWVEV